MVTQKVFGNEWTRQSAEVADKGVAEGESRMPTLDWIGKKAVVRGGPEKSDSLLSGFPCAIAA